MRYSFPTLPSAIDAKAQSVSVIRPPVALYEQPHYGGQALVIAGAGGCDDLATGVLSAGNWSNRIRSVRFLRSDDPLLQQSQTLIFHPPSQVLDRGARWSNRTCHFRV